MKSAKPCVLPDGTCRVAARPESFPMPSSGFRSGGFDRPPVRDRCPYPGGRQGLRGHRPSRRGTVPQLYGGHVRFRASGSTMRIRYFYSIVSRFILRNVRTMVFGRTHDGNNTGVGGNSFRMDAKILIGLPPLLRRGSRLEVSCGSF